MKSIRMRLTIFTLLLVIAPFLLSNIANSIYMNMNYEKELEQNNTVLVNSLADQVEAFIEKGYRTTEQIALNNDVKRMDALNQKKSYKMSLKDIRILNCSIYRVQMV